MGWTLPAGVAVLILGACDTVTPTTPLPPPVPPLSASPAPPGSVAVRGMVADSSGRPLDSALVAWEQVADDHDEWETHTDASGSYQLQVSGVAVNGRFEVGASKQGYKDNWKELVIPDPACTWNDRKCDLVANFTLMPQ